MKSYDFDDATETDNVDIIKGAPQRLRTIPAENQLKNHLAFLHVKGRTAQILLVNQLITFNHDRSTQVYD